MVDQTIINPNLQERGGQKKTPILFIVLIVVALAGGFFILRRPKKTEKPAVLSVENIKPSPTEKPAIDKKSVKIEVLNGTGTPGQAGKAVEAITKAGYNADNIKAENAKDYNNPVTKIAAKNDFSDIAGDIKEALKSSFDEIQIDSTPLDSSNEFDIIVTTGGKKYEEPTAAPTTSNKTPSGSPTPTSTITSSPTPTP